MSRDFDFVVVTFVIFCVILWAERERGNGPPGFWLKSEIVEGNLAFSGYGRLISCLGFLGDGEDEHCPLLWQQERIEFFIFVGFVTQ